MVSFFDLTNEKDNEFYLLNTFSKDKTNRFVLSLLLMFKIKFHRFGDSKPTKNRQGIHKAIEENNLSLVKYLIANGFDIKARDNYGDTPLELATELGHTEIVQALLEAKACTDMVCKIKLLQVSCWFKYIDIAKLLIKAGTDVNIRLEDESTLLIDVAGEGNFELTKILVEAGAEIDVIDRYGNSPLGLAINNGHQRIVDYFRLVGCFEERELLYLLSDD